MRSGAFTVPGDGDVEFDPVFKVLSDAGYQGWLLVEAAADDMGTQMDIGLLVMERGDVFVFEEAEKEIAVLLFAGRVSYEWDEQTVEADRPDCFRHEAYCLLAGRGTKVTLTARNHSELYIQKTVNEKPFTAIMYTPDTVQTQHTGYNGELLDCMEREIKTFFDHDNAPFSNMVLGEVLNHPGKWSSYPPHHHPQPEVYFYRFDYPQGFGAGFANGEIYQTGTTGAPSSPAAFTPSAPRPAAPCATPGASAIWRAIPG